MNNYGEIDLASIALHCGFRHTEHIGALDEWRGRADALLSLIGPVCAVLDVAPVREDYSVRAPGRPKERAREFAAALRGTL